jgi:Fe-S-cluster containining protein
MRGDQYTGLVVLDCLACGACCHGDHGWVPVDGRDDPAPPALAAHLVLLKHGALTRRSLRMVGGACSALVKERGLSTCTIYEVRPSTCRELEAGSPDCLAARRARGIQ